MPFADINALKPFLPEEHYFFKELDSEGLAEAFSQADNIITSFTALEAPDDAADADPILRNIAAKLVIHFTSGQGKLSEDELRYRKALYDEAMDMLRKIQEGMAFPGRTTRPSLTILSTEKRLTELP